MRKLSLKEWKDKAINIYGENAFCYDNVVYVNAITKVNIKCNTCGNTFKKQASNHLNGRGCPFCNRHHGRLVAGVGFTDIPFTTIKGKKSTSYEVWKNVLLRCYDKKQQKKRWQSYDGCSVCDEWLRFSNFKKWFDDNYVEGYHLDKDILVKDNKVYSPETCCFVPSEINTLIVNKKNFRGDYPIGVTQKILAGNRKVFSSRLLIDNKRVWLGSFDTPQKAFEAYKYAKEKHIKEVAQAFFDAKKITRRVYDALMEYQIKITD